MNIRSMGSFHRWKRSVTQGLENRVRTANHNLWSIGFNKMSNCVSRPVRIQKRHRHLQGPCCQKADNGRNLVRGEQERESLTRLVQKHGEFVGGISEGGAREPVGPIISYTRGLIRCLAE